MYAKIIYIVIVCKIATDGSIEIWTLLLIKENPLLYFYFYIIIFLPKIYLETRLRLFSLIHLQFLKKMP